jgi:hypothetical protein
VKVVRPGHQRRVWVAMVFATFVFVVAIGASRWLFGGAWVIDVMLAVMWVALWVALADASGKKLRGEIIETSLSPAQVQRAISDFESRSS